MDCAGTPPSHEQSFPLNGICRMAAVNAFDDKCMTTSDACAMLRFWDACRGGLNSTAANGQSCERFKSDSRDDDQ